jgi:hypothetical protein
VSIYIECDICGKKVLANKDMKSKDVIHYWLTPSVIYNILPDKAELKEVKEVHVCSRCDPAFDKKVNEFNNANKDWMMLLIESTRDEIKQLDKG